MKKIVVALLLAIILLASTFTPVQAREFEDAGIPPWRTPACLQTIYSIVQHESGNTKDDEIFQFITEQIIRDIGKYTCDGLTSWRWKIGNHTREIYPEVKNSVMKVVRRYPKTKFPACSFIGMKPDIRVWASYGYDTEIGFEKTVNGLTVVGVNCR